MASAFGRQFFILRNCQESTLLDEPIGFVIPGRKASPESQIAIGLIQFEILGLRRNDGSDEPSKKIHF